MNDTKTSCAPADNRNLTWDGMNLSKCEAYVRKLQARIVKMCIRDSYRTADTLVYRVFSHTLLY